MLNEHKKIDLSIEYDAAAIDAIKNEFRKYLKGLEKAKQPSIKREKSELDHFVGMVEKNAIKKSIRKYEIEQVKLAIKLKQSILKIPITNQKMFDQFYEKDLFRNILNADNGLVVQSKIVQLYLAFRDDSRFYDIPWLFYDILSSLKNFTNLKKSVKLSSILYCTQPYTIPLDLVKAFSTAKIIKLIESD